MLGGLALSLAAMQARAAGPVYRLAIPATSYAEALIALGEQTNVSVIGTAACGAGGHVGLSGARTLDVALEALTAGAPCTWRILDPRTVRILPRTQAASTRSAAPPSTVVAELLVTATKRPADVTRLPASVSVVSHDQIEATGALDVGALTGQVSGLLTTNLGPGRDKLILRGLSDGGFTGRTRSTVGSYLDDAPVNYNAPDPDLQLVDVERIEVVRGPQGALYGSGALSGVYRIVTRKPDLTGFAAGAAALAATTDGGSASNDVEAYANLPLIHDAAALRIVGYRDLEGGYIDNAALRLSNVDRSIREGGRAALRLQPSDAWQFDLSATVQRLRSSDTSYTTPDSSPGVALSPTERLSRVREGHKNDFQEIAATLRGELGWATLRSTAALIQHDFSSQYDASQVLGDLGLNPSGLGVYSERTRINMISFDTVLRSSGPGPLTWLAGVEGIATVEKTPTALDAQSPSGALGRVYSEARRDRLREASLYGEISDEITPGWRVVAGGRLTTSDVHTVSAITGVSPVVPRDFAGRQSFSGFSPKLSIQHDLASAGVVYALVSEGYRPGGFNSGGFLFPIMPSRATFQSDRLTNYEVGAKALLLGRRLTLRGAAFFDRWKDVQADQYRPSGLPFTGNVGDAEVKGLEAEAGYAFAFGLTVQANALLVATKISRPNLDFFRPNPPVDHLPGVPKFSGGLLAVYEHPLPANLTLRLIGETSYVGRSDLAFTTTTASEMGQYAKTELSAQLAGRGWTATLFVLNPANDHADTFSYGNPFTFGQVRQSTPQRPRTVALRLTADY
jgi:iron complex outermembrane receptor protein